MKAIMNYEKALHYNAECPDAYNGIGVVLNREVEPLLFKSNSAEARFCRGTQIIWGMVYEAKGLFDEALSCYQKAITINPAQADI